MATFQFSPQQGFFPLGSQPAQGGDGKQFLEKNFDNQLTDMPLCVAFDKADMEELCIGATANSFILFAKVKIDNKTTLAATRCEGMALRTDKIFIGNTFPSPTHAGQTDIRQFKASVIKATNAIKFIECEMLKTEAKTYAGILRTLQDFDKFTDMNFFLTVKFDAESITTLTAVGGCTKIAFFPVIARFSVERDIEEDGGHVLLYKFDMVCETLLAAAIKDLPNNKNEIINAPVAIFSPNTWRPNYPPYN